MIKLYSGINSMEHTVYQIKRNKKNKYMIKNSKKSIMKKNLKEYQNKNYNLRNLRFRLKKN